MQKSPVQSKVKGALIDGKWHCDCDPRLPAEHFQTKNGGQNHGRWFYTCQKSQPKRCKFFLWDDDAKSRAEKVLLENTRSEELSKTPSKLPTSSRVLLDSQHSPTKKQSQGSEVPLTENRRVSDASSLEYDWTPDHDQAMMEAVRRSDMPPPETPRKTPRTSHFTSPGKGKERGHAAGVSSEFARTDGEDVFSTPSTSNRRTGLLSPVETPAKERLSIPDIFHTGSNLAADAISILDKGKLPLELEKELIELLTKHDLRTQGIARGRDITRMALAKKDKRIGELEMRVSSLEAEVETNRAVIAHLKRDIPQTSPTRARRNEF